MKNIQFILISFFLVFTSYAQNPHNGVYYGVQNRNVYINDIIDYYDEGYYMQNTIASTFNQRAKNWSIKTNNNLTLLWDNSLVHNSGIFESYSAILDNYGNRYISGGLFTSNTSAIPMVVKFNACGEQEWCLLIPFQGYDSGSIKDMVINDDGDIIVLIDYLVYSVNQATSDCVFLAALSPEGELMWKQVYASPSADPLLQHPGCFYMTYHNGEYYLSGYCYYAYPQNPTHFYLTPFFVGINSQFQEKWILPFGMKELIRGRAYEIIPMNEDYLMGLVDHWKGAIEKITTLVFFNTKGVVTGYNPILNESLNPDYTWNVTTTAQAIDESVFISAIYFGPHGKKNWGEIIYDTSGNVYNFNVTGQHELDYKMTRTSDDNFLVGVSVKKNSNFSSVYVYKFDENLQSVPFDSTTYVYDSLCPYPIQSGTIDLSDCMVLTSTDWIPTPKEYYARISAIPITIYPNPAKDQITFTFENTEHHKNIELRCFNLLGVLQHQIKVQRGQQQYSANIKNWAPGIYIAVVYSDGNPVGRGKFVVQ